MAIKHEIAEATRKYGSDCFVLLCVTSSRGDTLSDAETLETLRHLNRHGSIFAKVICEVEELRNEKDL